MIGEHAQEHVSAHAWADPMEDRRNLKSTVLRLRKAKGALDASQTFVGAHRIGGTDMRALAGTLVRNIIDMNRRLAATCRSVPRSARSANLASGRTGWSRRERAARPERGGRQSPQGRWVRRLTVLNARERRVFEARQLADEPITLDELSDEVSREHVRQIEAGRRLKPTSFSRHTAFSHQMVGRSNVHASSDGSRPPPAVSKSSSIRNTCKSCCDIRIQHVIITVTRY
jgi:Sigma-70, region 4